MVEKKPQKISLPVEAHNGSIAEPGQKTRNLRMALEEFERQFIFDTMEQNLGHRGKTAAMLGIDRKTLYTKLKKYGVI